MRIWVFEIETQFSRKNYGRRPRSLSYQLSCYVPRFFGILVTENCTNKRRVSHSRKTKVEKKTEKKSGQMVNESIPFTLLRHQFHDFIQTENGSITLKARSGLFDHKHAHFLPKKIPFKVNGSRFKRPEKKKKRQNPFRKTKSLFFVKYLMSP